MRRVFNRIKAYVSSHSLTFGVLLIWVAAASAAVVVNVFYPTAPRGAVPRPQVTTVTVYVPAGPMVCPAEDSCRVDWDGNRWVVIPEVSR